MKKIPENPDITQEAVANDALFGAWIAVTPTSPPAEQAVWLWDATDEVGFIGWRMKNQKGGEWWESAANPPEWDAEAGEWNLYDDNFGDIKPTHWMPLPLPPNDNLTDGGHKTHE